MNASDISSCGRAVWKESITMCGRSKTHGATSTNDPHNAISQAFKSAIAAAPHAPIFELNFQNNKFVPMEDISTLNDRFATLLLKSGVFPKTMIELYDAIESTRGQEGGISQRKVFHIDEGALFSTSPDQARFVRQFRIAVIYSVATKSFDPDIMVSSGSFLDSERQFLQVMSWDPKLKAYHFYQRLGEAKWVWSGSSWDSLVEANRGKGPFCGHPNGAPNMKELKFPWVHWHSSESKVDYFGPEKFKDHPLTKSPADRGDEMEKIVQGGIRQWELSRCTLELFTKDPYPYFRQILGTNTVNLTSSAQRYSQVLRGENVVLPISFFYNVDLFEGVLDFDLDIESIVVPSAIYTSTMKKYNVRLETNGLVQPGDTHFAFVVPEVAFEDISLMEGMLSNGLITPRALASLTMVDFTNPTFTTPYTRQMLLDKMKNREIYKGELPVDTDFLDHYFHGTIASSKMPGSGPFQLGANVKHTPEERATWKTRFETRIMAFHKLIVEMAKTSDGFEKIFLLAESRRSRELGFRGLGISEFDLTLPVSDALTTSKLPEGIRENGTLFYPDGEYMQYGSSN